MKYIPAAVAFKASRALLVGKQNSPAILFVSGVVGVVGTTVLACRATLKMEDVLDEANEKLAKVNVFERPNYTEKDRTRDKTIVYVNLVFDITKQYAPAIALGGLSIAALTGSHRILTKRNAGLTAAYTALHETFKEYRGRVVKELGPEKDREFRYGSQDNELVKETSKGPKVETVKRNDAANGSLMYAKIFDSNNKNWRVAPEYNIMFLRMQQNYLNDRLKAKGHVLLNDAYDELGFDRTPAGAVVGWKWNSKTGDNYIDFGIFDDDKQAQFTNFVTGREGALLLDFNVDGVVYEQI